MDILYITNSFPYPLTSGYLRHYFFIRELARRHRVTLLSVVGDRYRPEHAAALAPFTEQVLTFASPGRGGVGARKVVDRARSLLGLEPAVRQLRAALVDLLGRRSFDAVVFSGKSNHGALAGLRIPALVADLCDAASMRFRGELRHTPWLERPLVWLQDWQVRRAERAILGHTAHVAFASSRDRLALLGQGAGRGTVLPNGVDLDYWRRSVPVLGERTLIMTGAMGYPPNRDAAMFLIAEILPRVRHRVPGTRVVIVGHSPPAALRREGMQPGVTVTGFVDDVRPYMEQATVFVAPLRFGAGIQNKLLEALAMELPTVTSPLAAEGLCTETGCRPPLRTAGTADQYADILVDELHRRSVDPAPASAGRSYVRQHFSWASSGERLEAVIAAAVSNA